jgi:SWI/SNF-related matrix-associated actin-dependent regulator 1 of chromatin subfamily A
MMNITVPYAGQDIEHIPGVKLTNQGKQVLLPIDALPVLIQRRGFTSEDELARMRGAFQLRPTYPPRKTPSLLDDARLRPYQRDGVRRVVGLIQRDGGHILADDMGLGKTLQTCATWDALSRPWPLLVVAPASVRRGWVKEMKHWLGVTPRLVETGKQAENTMPGEGVVIISFELLAKLPKSFAPHMIVIDELHLVRGRRTERGEALLNLCRIASYRLGLTGTPMWGRPRDLWNPLKLLFGYRFGTANQFDYAYCDASVNKWGGKENKGISRSEELKARLSHVMTRRTKAELGDQLPSLTRVIRWLPSEKGAKQALTAFALRQIRLTDALIATLTAKIKPVISAVEELEGHAIVFTWRKEDARALADGIEKAGYPAICITGDLTHKQREAAVARATKQKACVVATIDSTGTGVDGLQHVADTVLFHALDYTPIKMAQAESRAHRLGQGKPVTAVFFAMEDSADRLVVEQVVDKLEAWRQTMGSDSTSAMNDVMSAPATAEAEEKALAEIYAALAASEEEE